MEAILLAGGLGTRLHTVTGDNYPKCLAKVNGLPFLHYVLWYLKNQGITRFVIAVSHHADMIENEVAAHFSDWNIAFSKEQVPLGTGGAIKQALTQCQNRFALVVNADSFIEFSLPDFISSMKQKHADLGMVCTQVEDLSRFGAANIENDKLISFSEKGKTGQGYINAGIYWIHTSHPALVDNESKFSFERCILENQGVIKWVFKTKGLFFDIGTPDDFNGAQKLVELHHNLFLTSSTLPEQD